LLSSIKSDRLHIGQISLDFEKWDMFNVYPKLKKAQMELMRKVEKDGDFLKCSRCFNNVDYKKSFFIAT
jgi:hypothetical protein